MNKLAGTVSHREREIAELAADRELAIEYLRAAMESLDNPEERAGGLIGLRTVAEAYGGLGAVAADAGISRLRLSVESDEQARVWSGFVGSKLFLL